jgi:2-octaprenyl-6-methoxyphenol hydroxylase
VPPNHDCVVVGAGLVGAAQALALRQLGLDVVVADARGPLTASNQGDVRGLALAPSSQGLLAALGLWKDLEGCLTPIKHIQVTEKGRFGAIRLNAQDAGLDALGYVCPADHLLATIEAALTTSGPVQWRTALQSITFSPDAATVSFLRDGEVTQLSARLVIGADGAHSPVREAIGVSSRTRDYPHSAIVANVTLEFPLPETAFERFTSDGPLALLPLDGARYVVVRCCANDSVAEFLNLSDVQFLATLESDFGHRFGRFTDLSQRSMHPLSLSSADRITDRRAALVGAAANSIHPNGAQGLNLGLRDVAGLTLAVKQALNAYEDIGGVRCLAEFSRSRLGDQRAVVRSTDSLARLFSNSLPPWGLLRNIAMVALDTSPMAKRWLIRRATGLFSAATLLSIGMGVE